ncbi:MAG: hypothetical protein R3F45_16755 [Gammaproteobacteria bacterium]
MPFRRLARRGLRALVALEELLDASVGGLGSLADVTKLDEQEQFLITERGSVDHGYHPYGGIAPRF